MFIQVLQYTEGQISVVAVTLKGIQAEPHVPGRAVTKVNPVGATAPPRVLIFPT